MEAKFIYETLDFERGLDPKKSMNIGMDAKLDAWIQNNYGVKASNDKEALEYAVTGKNLEFVKYLIGVKNTEISNTALNLAFQKKSNYNLFLKNTIDDEIKLWLVTKGNPESMDYVKNNMKKIIGESINFERGKDPRDSMKIGIVNKRSFKTIQECAQFFIDNIQKLSDGRFKDKEELIYYFDRMDKTKHDSSEVIPPLKSPLRMSKDYLEGFLEKDALGRTLEHKYPPIYIEEWGTTFDQLLAKLQGLRDFHIEIQKSLGIHRETPPKSYHQLPQ